MTPTQSPMEREAEKYAFDMWGSYDACGYLSTYDDFKAGAEWARKFTIEECANKCREIWQKAPNSKENDFKQNAMAYGCLSCEMEIRALLESKEKEV